MTIMYNISHKYIFVKFVLNYFIFILISKVFQIVLILSITFHKQKLTPYYKKVNDTTNDIKTFYIKLHNKKRVLLYHLI